MSGAQIGTVVGGVVGGIFGGFAGAQIGMSVGGIVGGLIDPTIIKGPRIGDGQQQTATDGVPIAWVQGQATVAGTICQVGPRVERRHADDGKGSGTVTYTYTAAQTFAILICESNELRGSSIESVVMVQQDGKIVYDIRPGSTILEESQQWVANVDFLYGDEEQLPHPALEAVTGVGNTPAYRGQCIAVFRDFDLTKAGDRIPTFQFTVQSATSTAIKYTDNFKYRTNNYPYTDFDWGGEFYNDEDWQVAKGLFSNYSGGPGGEVVSTHIDTLGDLNLWLRKKYTTEAGTPTIVHCHVEAYIGEFYWNGEKLLNEAPPSDAGGALIVNIPAEKVKSVNQIAASFHNIRGNFSSHLAAGIDVFRSEGEPTAKTIPLSKIVQRIVARGGLFEDDVDVEALSEIQVAGYTVATDSNASDCLSPLLAAYFAHASEYDGQVHFRLYGGDADVTVDPADFLMSDVGTDGASLVQTNRSQATEYPRKMTSTYYDIDQNLNAVNVSVERNSVDVIAIGEQRFAIPVVMTATDATKATYKALKVAYAALEGTREYSLPFVGYGGQKYLSLVAGDPVILSGKRWVIDEMTLGQNIINLKTTYNRQSAYSAVVQTIPSNPPIPPSNTYGGLTTLIPMNLPSLRTQDGYGLYLAAAGENQYWPGCAVQVSYDDGQTWQSALNMYEPSVFGTLTAALGLSGEPLSVLVNGDLDSVTAAQIAARQNAAAILPSSGAVEIVQYQTATEVTPDHYNLTDLSRARLGTKLAAHVSGERFVNLASVYFLPIDLAFGETTIKLRAVTLGDAAETAAVVSIVYHPDDEVLLDGGGAPL